MSDCSRNAFSAGGSRILRKWSFSERCYKPYRVPASWRVSTYERDMATAVNCANCGTPIAWGDTYTSMSIHTDGGMGYGICERCYELEIAARKAGR